MLHFNKAAAECAVCVNVDHQPAVVTWKTHVYTVSSRAREVMALVWTACETKEGSRELGTVGFSFHSGVCDALHPLHRPSDERHAILRIRVSLMIINHLSASSNHHLHESYAPPPRQRQALSLSLSLTCRSTCGGSAFSSLINSSSRLELLRRLQRLKQRLLLHHQKHDLLNIILIP